MITLDTGHFHPTESVADKVSSLLLSVPELMLHVSRPGRWDSDHVTIMDLSLIHIFGVFGCPAFLHFTVFSEFSLHQIVFRFYTYGREGELSLIHIFTTWPRISSGTPVIAHSTTAG